MRMADAATRAVDCIAVLHQRESNLVMEVLRGHDRFTEIEHYPPDDVYDSRSHAQYYFHAHPPGDRNQPDFGHYHTFMRSQGMPTGVHPVRSSGCVPANGDNDALSHLIAIAMTPTGLPERLFTTNRWVTGETWYRASDVIAMLDCFALDLDYPSRALNEWLTAVLVLFRPQIEQLLFARDRAVEDWQRRHPEADVFEDRRLEITSSMPVSLYEHIEWLRGELARR